MPLSQLLTSNTPFNITIHKLKGYNIGKIQVFNKKLIILASSLAYIVQLEPCSVVKVSLLQGPKIDDLTLTPSGEILYIIRPNRVILATTLGEIIKESIFKDPRSLSVSSDGVIYLADFQDGFYVSEDGGKNFMLKFKPQDGWHATQVIKVTWGESTEIWSIEYISKSEIYDMRLRIYTVDKESFNKDNILQKDFNLSQIVSSNLNLLDCKVLFDGSSRVFLSDNRNQAIYVLSTDGQNGRLILSLKNIGYSFSLAYERHEQKFWLYVGMKGGMFGVFKYDI